MENKTFTYKSIANPATGLFKEKGSKFMAFAYPVKKEEEIKPIIDKLKKEYHDARHHCFAYRLGADKSVFRVNDDGEPSGTAGKPILGQIQSADLSNILIVVVRYFGGKLLGTSGLIQAYKESSADAIKNATIINCFEHSAWHIKFAYIQLNTVMKILKEYDIQSDNQQFDTECIISISVKKSLEEIVLNKLKKIESIHLEQFDDN